MSYVVRSRVTMHFLFWAVANVTAGLVIGVGGASAQGTDVQTVIRAGSLPAVAVPATRFTGKVSVTPIADPRAPRRTSLGAVTFPPGARSNWHTHPGGQILYVLEGCGWTQQEGRPVERICKGDTVSVPAGVKHWHGATATEAMTHLAITETLDGRNVDWLGPVTDAQYRGPTAR